MGKRGPKAKPKVVRLRNNPKNKASDFKDNPEFGNDNMVPPKELSTAARKEWIRMVVLLDEAGLMSNAYVDALAQYCEATVTYWENLKKLRKEGYISLSANGHPMINPRQSIVNGALAQMRSIGNEFGLTPSSTTRINLKDKDRKKGSKFQNLEED